MGNEGKSEIQKFEYLENENNFLIDEVKSIFHNYLRVIIVEEKQNRGHKKNRGHKLY